MTMRFCKTSNKQIENPKIDAFLDEIDKVCRLHGFSISHIDAHGEFEIIKYSVDDAQWLAAAVDATNNLD